MSALDNIELNNWYQILNTMPNPVVLNKKIIDENGDVHDEITFVNKVFSELIGYSVEEIPTDTIWFEKAYPDKNYRNYVMQEWFDLVEIANENNENLLGFTAKIMCNDGHERWFQVTTSLDYPISNEYHLIIFVEIQTPEDIILNLQTTTQKLYDNKDKLANQLNLIEDIINTVPVRIFWKNKEGVYLGANQLFLEDAKVKSTDDIIGKNDFQMPWGETEAQLYRDDDLSIMNSGKSKMNFEETQTDDNGNIISVLTSKVPLEDESGNIIGLLGAYTDISKLKNIESELKEQKDILHHQAYHDFLTQLPNRVLFNDRLEQAIEKAKRNNTMVALLFIDLDHFKEINDSLGHSIGDEVLKVVTSIFQKTMRNKDTIARLGGDEFSIILEDLERIENASIIANKLLESLSQFIMVGDNKLHVSSSIGISIYPDDGTDSQSLLKFADSAMYKAKDEGRNKYQYYDSKMTEIALERVVMETGLRDGLKNKEFIVYYQTQIDGRTDEIIGMEALVRWKHPTMGLVPPDKFIPLAESTGLIIELDEYVMKTAMTQLTKWYKMGLNPGILAMNLSVKQLQRENFIFILENLIQEVGCKTKWLELEITEGQVMSNPEESIKILQQISDIGIKLAIDDFGTGYSSLAYLKRLPIDKLKIDQAFIRDLPDDEDDVGITKAVIALAKSLKLEVIAEGVETKAQRDFLVANKCNNIQGYFYAKPMPASEVQKVLNLTLNPL